MFSSAASVKGHDRYLIYRMMGRRVRFPNPSRRAKGPVSAVVVDVSRDIFTNEVELTSEDGRTYRFKEPAVILAHGDDVVFLYGDVGRRQSGDSAVFKEMRTATYGGETMDDVMKRTELRATKQTRFCVGEAVVPRVARR